MAQDEARWLHSRQNAGVNTEGLAAASPMLDSAGE
jgi:hypothetical protein